MPAVDRERLEFGVKAIDGLNTIEIENRDFCRFRRGKKHIDGMIVKNVKADINVIMLVGAGAGGPGVCAKDLGEEGMNRSVLGGNIESARHAQNEMPLGRNQ